MLKHDLDCDIIVHFYVFLNTTRIVTFSIAKNKKKETKRENKNTLIIKPHEAELAENLS